MLKVLHQLFFGNLRRQLITSVALVHAVLMSVFILDLVSRQQAMLQHQRISLAKSLTESVATTSAVWLASRDIEGLQDIIDAQQRYPELVFAMVLDNQGHILAHSDTSRRGQYVIDLPLLRELRVLSQSASLVDVIGPITLNDRQIGWVRIGIGQMSTQTELAILTKNGLLYALAAIVIGGIAAAYMGRRLTRRLHSIQTVADAVEAGHYTSRVCTDGTDEAAQLGQQFNNMLDTLASRDIELRMSYDSLRESEERFRTLVHNIPGITYRCDASQDWAVEFISEEVLDVTGYPASDFINHLRHWASIVHPDDLQRVSDAVNAAVESHQPYVIEYRIVRADKNIGWVFEKGQAIYDPAYQVKHLDGVILDISERKQIEESLRRTENAWQTAMNHFDDVIYILDRNRHLKQANAAFYKFAQNTPEHLLGRHITEIIHPQGETEPCPVCRAQNELRDARIIMEANHPDNPAGRPLEITVKILRNENNEVSGILMSLHDLTHDRSIQSKLAESESRYRAIIEASPNPIALNDADGNILYLNPVFTRNFGYTLNDIPHLDDWWPRAYPNAIYRQQVSREWLSRAEYSRLHNTPVEPMEVNIRCKDDTVRTVVVSASPLGKTFGSMQMVLFHDITERKLSEEALRASEQRFHAIADYTVEWENWVSPEGKLLWINPSVKRITGYSVEECMAMPDFPLPLIAPEDREKIRTEFSRALDNSSGYSEFRLLHKNGNTIWASVSWQPIYDAQGKTLGHRSSVRDISSLKQAEENVRQLNTELEKRIEQRTAELHATQFDLEQFKHTLDQTLDCVFMFDPDSLRFSYINRGAQQQVGYNESELLCMTPVDIKPEYDEDRFRREVMSHIIKSPNEMYRFETLHRHKDGHDIPVEVSLQMVKLSDGVKRCVAVVRDISDRRTMEALAQKRLHDAETANRELEAFAYSISHDLRAPLRSIDGFSRILAEDYSHKLDDTGLNYLQRVRRAVQRMGILIDDLLELSRLGRSELHPVNVDMTRLAHEITEQLRTEYPDRKINIKIAPHVHANGDEMLLRLVLQNLLDNAWKYTRPAAEAEIEFGSMKINGEAVFYVRDNGAGFDMQYADKLFGVFQRLHKAEEFAGTGVGLATVQRIIHRHGGRVWAEAKLGKGACFYFTLPGRNRES
jgi:PAS domain S-box-containing protein